MVSGLGFRVCRFSNVDIRAEGSSFEVWWGIRVEGSGSKVVGFEFKVPGSGFRVAGSGFRAQGSALGRRVGV